MNYGSRGVAEACGQDALNAALLAQPSFRWNAAVDRFWWSASLYALYGFAPEEIEPSLDALVDSLHPDDRETGRQALEQVRCDGRSFVFELRLIIQTGQEKSVILSAQAGGEAFGTSHPVIGTLLDVTDARHLLGTGEETASEVRAELDRAITRAEALDLIHQATGVLMERYKVPAEEAHKLLRRASQLAGRKLVRVASDLLFTGSLPPPMNTAARIHHV